jgi:hypothetical protein
MNKKRFHEPLKAIPVGEQPVSTSNPLIEISLEMHLKVCQPVNRDLIEQSQYVQAVQFFACLGGFE